MKGTKLNFLTMNFFAGILAILLIFSFTSCAKKITFLNSSVVPAAQGTVKIKKDNNKNYSIQIEVFNLAEPERLQPPRKMYVVWMSTDKDITKNIGLIKTSTKNFSKKLQASFESVSSFKPTKIFITAEDDPNIQKTDSEIVLSTDRF
jgi:hypothetical protein